MKKLTLNVHPLKKLSHSQKRTSTITASFSIITSMRGQYGPDHIL